MVDEESARGRYAQLSLFSRVLTSVTAAVVAVLVVVHVGAVFLHLAPSNVVSERYDEAIDDYIRPEFVQNWKLFAPEPLYVNRAIHARAEISAGDGIRTTEWIDVTATDIAATRGHLLPSHTRNQLRKGWRTYTASHDDNDQPRNLTGRLIEQYLKRVVLMRLSHEFEGAAIERVQLRSSTTRVPEPEWSTKRVSDVPSYQELPWWPVSDEDFPAGSVR
ncbi:MAG: hypothetical protein GEU86_12150 [Actinophytocola sp.]|nr:hypothetical protein [Actinophytocola sp.]